MIFIYDNSITLLLRTALVYYKSLMDSNFHICWRRQRSSNCLKL